LIKLYLLDLFKNTALLLFGLLIFSCKSTNDISEVLDATHVHQANQRLIEITMEDVFNPPLASRIFCYPNLAAYEVYNHKQGQSFFNEKISKGSISLPDTSGVDFSIASLIAFSITAKKLVFSEYMMDSLVEDFHKDAIKKGQSESKWKKSYTYGESVAQSILQWSAADNYAKVKSDDQYTIKQTDSSWVLTPPNYEQALEPNWKKMRLVFLKDVQSFRPKPRPVFSKEKQSEFYKYAMEVYTISKSKEKENSNIALYWDCNPNEFNDKGHNTHFVHKISPPGHWVNITSTLCKLKKQDFENTLKTYSAVTSAMYDGLIVCWDTKYREELIRPVTYINKYIDKTWLPFIQTPPFPEYTSGHSTVSGAASSILELAFPNTAFTDSTEVAFGLNPKAFKSANEAGQEASYSRLYGGIHYRFGVENGFENGQNIGRTIYRFFNK
jgi:PAP2 superfamily